MSLSSDAPVSRWFGTEILEHTARAVDMTRAKRGLPLLFNHDSDQPIGRLEDMGLRGDGKLGGLVRFSRNARAQEVKRDVEDGILTDLSVGYRINAWTEERSADTDEVTYRVTDWTPLEGSIVPVPADHTVGVNRSAGGAAAPETVSPDNAPMKGKEHSMAENTPAPEGARSVTVHDGRMPRDLEVKYIGEVARTFGMEKALPEWISAGKTLDEVRQAVEAENIRKAQAPTPAGDVGLSPKEEKQYNISRAILALANGTFQRDGGFEKEVSDAIAARMPTPARGFYLPLGLQTRASVTGQVVGTSSLGGAAVQTTLQPVIEILRNRLVVRRAGARFLTGLTDTISFPRQITANSFTWTGENPTAANTLTALTLNNLTMSPKTGMASTAFSRQVLVQSSPDMQALVLDDIANVVALGIDLAAISGTGSSQPTGVRGTSGIGNRTLGANAAALAWADLVGLETDVAASNADVGSLAYITNASVRGKLKTTLKSTTAGAVYLWEGGNDPGMINGYNAFCSNQIPSNLTQGTSTTICSSIVFGNWAECLVGVWGNALDIIADPYTSKNQNMIEVTGISMVDVGVRHAASFSKSDAVLTS